MDVNICKTKHLTNTRASGSDALRLVPISKLSLEGAYWSSWHRTSRWRSPPEPRIRKQILNHEQRMKAKSKKK